jgi:hypothetical protein
MYEKRLGFFLRKERIFFVESLFGPPNKVTNNQQNDHLYFILNFIKISYQTTSQSVTSYNTQITYFLNTGCLFGGPNKLSTKKILSFRKKNLCGMKKME